MKCGICSREWNDAQCKVIPLTEAEREHIRKTLGKEPPDRYVYCAPCWRLLSNREQGAQFIAGMIRAGLRDRADPRAEKIGRRMYQYLIERSGKTVS